MQDFEARAGEDQVDRDGVIRTLKLFVEANELRIDWKGIREASNEALVNALSMMSPFEPREKQALLEAPDLKTRAEILIAITEMELARGSTAPTRRCNKPRKHRCQTPRKPPNRLRRISTAGRGSTLSSWKSSYVR